MENLFSFNELVGGRQGIRTPGLLVANEAPNNFSDLRKFLSIDILRHLRHYHLAGTSIRFTDILRHFKLGLNQA